MRISDWSSDVCSSDLSNLGIGNPAGVHDLFSLGGSISYEVDVVGRIRRAIEAATADEQAQAAALDLANTTVAAAVVGAYTDVCAVGASLAVAEHYVALQVGRASGGERECV